MEYLSRFKYTIFELSFVIITAQKMKFSVKDFFSKCDQIRRKPRIWLRLLKKSLMESFIFCVVYHLNYEKTSNTSSSETIKGSIERECSKGYGKGILT